MTVKAGNFMTDALAESTLPRFKDALERRKVTTLTTFELLAEVMRQFQLPARFDFFVALEPMQADLEASLAAVGIHRDGNSWSLKAPVKARKPAHRPA